MHVLNDLGQNEGQLLARSWLWSWHLLLEFRYVDVAMGAEAAIRIDRLVVPPQMLTLGHLAGALLQDDGVDALVDWLVGPLVRSAFRKALMQAGSLSAVAFGTLSCLRNWHVGFFLLGLLALGLLLGGVTLLVDVLRGLQSRFSEDVPFGCLEIR